MGCSIAKKYCIKTNEEEMSREKYQGKDKKGDHNTQGTGGKAIVEISRNDDNVRSHM